MTGAGSVGFGWLAVAVLVPLVVLVGSSFVKVAVVLSALRAGLGRSIPPASASFALALVLALFVMAPVGERMWAAASPSVTANDPVAMAAASDKIAAPLREFLDGRVPDRERRTFVELQRRLRPPAERAAVGEKDLVVLAPAFVVSELKVAFMAAFLLLLPFLVLDLVVANLLAVLGMNALDPRAVALPFKLLLFVLADGWHLLARGLVAGYAG